MHRISRSLRTWAAAVNNCAIDEPTVFDVAPRSNELLSSLKYRIKSNKFPVDFVNYRCSKKKRVKEKTEYHLLILQAVEAVFLHQQISPEPPSLVQVISRLPMHCQSRLNHTLLLPTKIYTFKFHNIISKKKETI